MYHAFSRRTTPAARTTRLAAVRPGRATTETLERRTLLSAGDLDPTFSGDGFVFGADTVTSRGAEAVAVQADGKVVVVGGRSPVNNYSVDRSMDLVVSRFNADGTRDATFGSNGSIVADLGGYDVGYAVRVDEAGRIVVGATAHNRQYSPQWVVLRYLPGGAPDASFGAGGRVSVAAGETGGPGLNGLDLAPGGKIVAGGRTSAGATVMRFTAAGQLDPSFDGDGKAIAPGVGTSSFVADGVDVMGDGRVVIAGRAASTAGFVARFEENGSPDSTFDADGRAAVGIEARDVAVDSAGRIVVAGTANNDAALRRLTPTGQADATFGGGDGLVSYDAPGDAYSTFDAVVIAAGDKPVAAGMSTGGPGVNDDFLTARFTAAGAFDPSFNGAGYALQDFFGGDDRAHGVALAPGGKTVVAGYAAYGATTEGLVRYNPDGTPDATFDADGRTTGPFEGSRQEIHDVLVQPDRKVVVGGASTSGMRVEFFLARFNPDGTPDTTFDGDGRLATYFGNQRRTTVRTLLLQPDGKIVAVGSVAGDVDLALARYHPDGSLDTAFGGDGTVVNDFGLTSSFATDAALYPGGRIVVSGTPGLVRYNPDGSLDRTFGGNGVVEGVSGQILVQGDKVLVDRGVSVARYNADGSPDPTFAGPALEPGIETGDEDDEEAYSDVTDMAFAPDGDVIVLGHVHDHEDEREKYALWRLNPDGTLDPAFGRGGRVIQSVGEPYHINEGEVVVQPDGKILVDGAGEADDDGRPVSVVVRHDPDGSLDTTFGIDGVSLFGRRQEFGADPMALDPTGDIVVAGRGRAVGARAAAWGVARLDGAGTAGGVTLDRHSGVLTVKGELTNDNIKLNLSRGRLFVTVNGNSYSFTRTSVREVQVYGRDGNDTVTALNEIPDLSVSGGAGDDALRGGVGRERLMGNDGNDYLDGGLGADTLAGGAGTDTLDYRSRTNAVRVTGGDAGSGGNGEAGENDSVVWDIEKVYGGSGDDLLHVLSWPNGAVFGGAGDDTLKGNSGIDALWGDDGDDVLINTYGADYFRGGAGNDTYIALEDLDHRTDVVITLDGVANDGQLDAGPGGERDNVFTDVENVVTGAGNDHVTGSSSNNRLEGGDGNDTLLGQAGDDTLVGGAGADTLTDTQGNNTFDGGRGADTVNGVNEPSDAVTLQAENAARSGAVIASTHPGYTGTGYVDFNNTGDWVEFSFAAPSAGRYRITFRYANGTASDKPLLLQVNGNYMAQFSFGPTGGWSQWGTNHTDVELAAGTHRFRLLSNGGDGPNIDSLVVE